MDNNFSNLMDELLIKKTLTTERMAIKLLKYLGFSQRLDRLRRRSEFMYFLYNYFLCSPSRIFHLSPNPPSFQFPRFILDRL